MKTFVRSATTAAILALLGGCRTEREAGNVEVLPENAQRPVGTPGTVVTPPPEPTATLEPAPAPDPEPAPPQTPAAAVSPASGSLFATPLAAPDVPTYLSAVEQEVGELKTAGNTAMPKEASMRLSVLMEQLARGKDSGSYTAEQKQAIGSAQENIEKAMSRAQSSKTEQEYEQELEKIRQALRDLRRQIPE